MLKVNCAGRRIGGVAIWCGALLILSALAPVPVSAADQDSVLEIPVRFSIAPLLAEIENIVPAEVRRDRSWKVQDGVEVRFAARRGPLAIFAQNDVLFLRTTVAYWLEARKRLLGAIPVSGSCGLEEPPRLAVITLAVRFGMRPDWQVDARPAVLPPVFLNPCLMTAVGIDVTGSLASALQEELWRAASRELTRLVAESGDGRTLAGEMWSRLQSPLSLDEATWLVLNPQAIWVTQPMLEHRDLTLSVGLAARPRLVTGTAPVTETRPLPALHLAAPRVPVVRFPVQFSIPYEDADTLLRTRLSGRSFSWTGKSVVIDKPRLLIEGAETLAVEAEVSGDMSGRLWVSGSPAYDNESRELYLADVEYELKTEDAEARDLDRLLHELVVGMIAEQTRWPLDERLREGLQRVEQRINQALPEFYRLFTRLDKVELTEIRLSERSIDVKGVFEGNAEVATRPVVSNRGGGDSSDPESLSATDQSGG